MAENRIWDLADGLEYAAALSLHAVPAGRDSFMLLSLAELI